jgi:hypothetical protein
MTIHFILLQNRAGKTRLAKWYDSIDDEEKEHHKSEVHRIVTSRDPKFTNFVEVNCKQPSIDVVFSIKNLKLFTEDMLDYSLPSVLILTIMNYHTWRVFTCLWKY